MAKPRLVSSWGGVFEVKAGDQLLFSKKALGRFPEEGEVEAELAKLLSRK